MSKNRIRGLAAAGIGLVLFNVLAFVIPFVKCGTFWSAYVFGMIAILLQIPVMYYAFSREQGVKSKFYGFPIARIAVIYLCTQLILSIIAMAVGQWVPAWISVVLFILILGAAAFGFIGTDAMRDEIERQDIKLKANVSRMKTIRSLAASLPAQCKDSGLRKEAEEYSEQLRFSDPVSSEATADCEAELQSLTEEMQKAILDSDVSGAKSLCGRAQAVLAERNRLCKLNK